MGVVNGCVGVVDDVITNQTRQKLCVYVKRFNSYWCIYFCGKTRAMIIAVNISLLVLIKRKPIDFVEIVWPKRPKQDFVDISYHYVVMNVLILSVCNKN